MDPAKLPSAVWDEFCSRPCTALGTQDVHEAQQPAQVGAPGQAGELHISRYLVCAICTPKVISCCKQGTRGN